MHYIKIIFLKSHIVTFFTFILLGYLVIPTIASLIGDSKEITIYFDLNEEEENKEEANKDFEIKIDASENKNAQAENKYEKKDRSIFSCHRYSSKYLEVNTPPPKVLS